MIEDIVTPQEATAKLFEAAKSGDTAAAQAAYDAGADLIGHDDEAHTPLFWAQLNGHTDTAHFLNKKWHEESDRRTRRQNNTAEAGMLISMTLFGLLLYNILSDNRNIKPVRDSDNKPAERDLESAQKQLRSALKDPAMTSRLIEQVRDPSVIQKFMDDPEIMQNLQRLATAIEGDGKHPEKWTEKAIGGPSSQSQQSSV
jgi:hypothetical protein